MGNNMQSETRLLERQLRENMSGVPQVIAYDTSNGNMEVQPVNGNGPAPRRFGCLNTEAFSHDFGGGDVAPTCVYNDESGNIVEVLPPAENAPASPDRQPGSRFGSLLGRSFTSTYGCDVTVASVRGDDLTRSDASSASGYAYTLEEEGVVRIVRGEPDAFSKGTANPVWFAWGDSIPDACPPEVRYVVLVDAAGKASVVERTPEGERVVPVIHVVPSKQAQHAVGFGLVESPVLKDKRVLLLGVGSMGSDVAMHLAMAGVGKLVLVDPDRVEASNLSRLRDAVIADVGRRKVDVLAERIAGKNPDCEVVKVPADITKTSGRMDELLAEVDIAVVSTDNRISRVLFAQGLKRMNKTCVFTRCSTRAESGDCFISRPGEACYECFYGSFGGAPDEVDDFDSAKKAGRLAAYCTPGEMHDFAILPGLSTDISAITTFASRLVIWELARTLDGNPYERFCAEFRPFNYFLYVNRREKYFRTEAWAPFDHSAHRPCPQRWYGAAITRRADCEGCGDRCDELDAGDNDVAVPLAGDAMDVAC